MKPVLHKLEYLRCYRLGFALLRKVIRDSRFIALIIADHNLFVFGAFSLAIFLSVAKVPQLSIH